MPQRDGVVVVNGPFGAFNFRFSKSRWEWKKKTRGPRGGVG